MSETAATPTAPAAPAETLSGDALASSLIGEVAAVPVAPVAPVESAPAVPAGNPKGQVGYPTDALGRIFDSLVFRSKPDGSPFLNARGHFMPKGGRKPGRATVAAGTAKETPPRPSYVPPIPEAPRVAEPSSISGKPTADVPPPPQATPAISRTALEQTAEGYLRGAYTLLDAAFQSGREWQPDDSAEHAANKEPLVEALQVMGAKPLPALFRFGVVAVAYCFKRFSRPKTAAAASSWWSKVNGAKPVTPVTPAATQPAAQPRPSLHPLTIEPLR